MSEPRRFVILTHDYPVLHWDLMLDTGVALRTWRLEQEPQSGVAMRAVALPDHRRLYLDYEGPVSGDRGTVLRWDAGSYVMLEETSALAMIEVNGHRVSGVIEFVRTDGDEQWEFSLRKSSVES